MSQDARHYYRDVSHLDVIDIYRISELYDIHPCAQHAVKKLLCAGVRGAKDVEHDIRDAISTLQRWLEMRSEDSKVLAPVKIVCEAPRFDESSVIHPDMFGGSDYPDSL